MSDVASKSRKHNRSDVGYGRRLITGLGEAHNSEQTIDCSNGLTSLILSDDPTTTSNHDQSPVLLPLARFVCVTRYAKGAPSNCMGGPALEAAAVEVANVGVQVINRNAPLSSRGAVVYDSDAQAA
jgi:hypothetical protein